MPDRLPWLLSGKQQLMSINQINLASGLILYQKNVYLYKAFQDNCVSIKHLCMSREHYTNVQWLYVVYGEMYIRECHAPRGHSPSGT